METCQIHQAKIDHSRKLAEITPIHGTRDEARLDRTSFFDWGMVYTSDQRREHNTLCHRIIALWSGGDGSVPIISCRGCLCIIIHAADLGASRVNQRSGGAQFGFASPASTGAFASDSAGFAPPPV
jgi:hypothetical protein